MDAMAAPAAEQPPVEGAIVEGLFVRALKASGAFAEELRTVGIDVHRLEPRYPAKVFENGMRVAHRHVYPSLSEAAAHRELGTRFSAGYLETILGRVMGGAATLFGPEAFVKRLPKIFAAGHKAGTAEAIKEGDRLWRIRASGLQSLPHFIAGSLETMMRQMKVEPRIEVAHERSDSFDLVIRW